MLYSIAKSVLKPLLFLAYNVKVEGLEKVPKSNGYIVCGNHIKAIDPFLLALSLPGQIHFMAKVELFKNKLLRFLLYRVGAYPIKRGEPDLKSIRTSLKLLQENKNIGIFPEGTRNKTEKLKAEPGIVMLAVKSKKGILPVSIKTNYKLFNKTSIVIGDIISLDDYHDKKLKNNDYIDLSFMIMEKIKAL